MEQTSLHVQSESIACSICLELLKDPVTTPCGHNYCMKCLNDYWDVEDGRGGYRCPLCMKTYTERPVLMINTMLAELLEDLTKVGPQTEPDESHYAGPDDVACDVCTGRKLKALKSCLMCLVSYCDEHLQSHMNSPAFGRHRLAEPYKRLQEVVCSRHDKVMTIFCRSDQQVLCSLCALDEHRSHDTVSAVAARGDREKEVEVRRGRVRQSVQHDEERLELLQQVEENINHSADKALQDSDEIFDEIIRQIQERKTHVEKEIRTRQETEVSRVRGLQEELKKEITELRRQDDEFGELLDTMDNVVFLQRVMPVVKDTPSSKVNIPSHGDFENLRAVLSQFRDQFQNFLQVSWTSFTLNLTREKTLQSDPKTRDDFLNYALEMSLDPNTAHQRLLLSEGSRRVTLGRETRSPKSHPDRFIKHWQVLTRETLTGRCYWEVERAGGDAAVAVVHKSISRAGEESAFGRNGKSWSLFFGSEGCKFQHNDATFHISDAPLLKVGVYLDQEQGLLSFHRVSADTATVLHTVRTSFTRPLHVGLRVYDVATMAELVKLSLDTSDC
ncbi:tripartite motif-containing protein 16-like [Neosynchiropus ocellatus]